jgi:hypothetical protein
MSELLQSGQHPDADQLSAFIEHALPAHEQEQTLAHLAICSHCRGVVALSLPPVEELPEPHLKPFRRPWLSGWNLVWPAAAALAALVLAGIYIKSGIVTPSHAPPTQTAQSLPPPHLDQPPQPTLKLESPRASARGPARPSAAPGREIAPESQAADRLMPIPRGRGENELHFNQNRVPSSGASTAPGGTAATQSTVITGSAANQAIQTESPAVGGSVAVFQSQAVPGRHGLPSGLRVLSTVANARQVVAIDTHNTLFYSNDAGAHWNVITPPWQGRAITVELVPTSNSARVRTDAAAAAPAGIVGGIGTNSAVEGAKASLKGEVTDLTGASIPNASVVVTNSLTQVARQTKTDPGGRYNVDRLDPGNYTLDVEAPGFTPQRISGVALTPAQQGQKDLTLAVGSLSQTVEVQGQAQPALAAPKVNEKIAAARAAVPPPSLFEITTDAGEHWTSTDGRSWTRQDGTGSK